MSGRKRVVIYTDGACLGNPGAGGYAAVLIFRDAQGKEHRKEISGGYRCTTNNRMELMAVIQALESLKYPVEVDLFTDSRYIANALEQGWLQQWKRRQWRRRDGKPVKNRDLWQRLDQALQRHTVRFHWVRGHSGIAENERVDRLAVEAAKGTHLQRDVGYETAYRKCQE